MTDATSGRRVSEMVRALLNNPHLEPAAREMAVARLGEHLTASAREVLGEGRDLRATLDPDSGRTQVTQRMRLVAVVNDPLAELALDRARRLGVGDREGQTVTFELHQDPAEDIAAKRFDLAYGDLLGLAPVEGSAEATRRALDRKLNAKLAASLAPTMGQVRAALKNGPPAGAPMAATAPARKAVDPHVTALAECVRDLLAVVTEQQRRLDALAPEENPRVDVEAALARVEHALAALLAR